MLIDDILHLIYFGDDATLLSDEPNLRVEFANWVVDRASEAEIHHVANYMLIDDYSQEVLELMSVEQLRVALRDANEK